MNKKRKYAYAAMTSAALAIAVIIILNLIAVVVADKISLSLDFTKGGILDFDPKTHEVISELDMDVRIISLIPQGDVNREMVQLDEILKKYDTLSDRITYERADAQKNPALLTSYKVNGEPLTDGYNSIFETDRMNPVVGVNDMRIMYKDNTNDAIHSGALKAEHYFTSALLKVTKGSDINAYVTTGHGEKFDSEDFKADILPATGYMFHDWQIMSDPVPDNADIVVIAGPKTDYSADEINKLASFMSEGGSLQVFLDPTTPALEGLFGFLTEWGIEVGNGLVGDDDTSHYAKYRTTLIPDIEQNDMTETISYDNTRAIFPVARPVTAKNKNDITAYTIASTSQNGYIKNDIYSVYDVFEAGDTKQASDIAVMVTRPSYDGKPPKLFVSGSVAFLEVRSNTNFYTGLMASMTDQPYSIYIQPKNIVQARVAISQSTIYVYSFIVIILIPVIILACGFVIWIKRRHL